MKITLNGRNITNPLEKVLVAFVISLLALLFLVILAPIILVLLYLAAVLAVVAVYTYIKYKITGKLPDNIIIEKEVKDA